MSIPEGATHKGELGRYYRCVEGQWFYANNFGHWRKYYSGRPCGLESIEQPKPWSGPEDGLPPVGLRVMVYGCLHEYTTRFNGKVVRIVCHDEGEFAVFETDDNEYHALVAEKFKLPPTAEQIAASVRETAIREVMDIAQVDCRVTAARLVDAGFKREVV